DMRKLLVYGLMIFLMGCSKNEENSDSSPVPPPAETLSVSAMTYNIFGARSGGIPDLQMIADVINRAKPDLVALQEVDKNTTRNSKNGDIAKKLAELTGMDYHFAKAINVSGGEYGDAVLSRLPIKEKQSFNLEVDPTLGGERRSVARILVEKEGKEFYFISTHFDHLSDLPASTPITILRTSFTYGWLNGNCTQYTFSTTNPDRTIDYLIYAPLNAFTPTYYTVYTWANKESDHFPVIATFKLNF